MATKKEKVKAIRRVERKRHWIWKVRKISGWKSGEAATPTVGRHGRIGKKQG